MLVNLELKCFRKHVALNIDFSKGLNVIRGANEKGKSTILEAILYALYGSRALRNPLADTVTWGHKENELSVRLKLVVNNKLYTFKRSKSGAECTYADVDAGDVAGSLVTGQAEVTALAAEILGAELKSASSLMLANQNSLRGALDEGPAAVSSLMAKLADFDLIDRLLDRANSTLATGSPTMLQSRLTDAQTRLAQLQHLTFSDPEELQEGLKGLLQYETGLQDVKKGAVQKLLEAEDAVNKALANNKKRDDLNELVGQLLFQEAATAEQIKQASEVPGVSAEAMAQAQARVDAARNHAELVRQFNVFRSATFPELHWTGTEEEYRAAKEAASVSCGRLYSEFAELRAKVNAEKGRLIKDGKCPTCGHDKNDPEHTAKHNAEVNASVQALSIELAAKEAEYNEAQAEVSAYTDVENNAAQYLRKLAPLEGLLAWSKDTYPPKASWKDAAPGAFDKDAEPALAALQAKDRTYQQAQGRLIELGAKHAQLSEQIAASLEQARAIEYIDTKPLYAVHADAARAASDITNEIATVQLNIERCEERLRELLVSIDYHKKMVDSLQEQVNSLTSDIKTMEFNNALMKKLKAMKPMITDYLWGQVLKAVGLFFSQMRGEQSVVTKDGDGFKVNGKAVESLSGSTLDVLALAIRCALVKTFIPHANFLVLDEPAAGCDDSRTGNVLGFVSTIGFSQTIMASHDVLSEAVADNVISLGA